MKLNTLLAALQEYGLRRTPAGPDPDISGLDFYEHGVRPGDGRLLLCTAQELDSAVKTGAAALCVCGEGARLPESVPAAACSCGIRTAFRLLSGALEEYSGRRAAFLDAFCRGAYADALLELGAGFVPTELYLLNAGGQLLASAGTRQGASDGAAFLNLGTLTAADGEIVRMHRAADGGELAVMRLECGCYLAAACGSAPPERVCALLECMALPVGRAARENRILSGCRSAHFSTAVGEVLDRRITDEAAVRGALFPGRAADETFYRIAVIAFDEARTHEAYETVISALAGRFAHVRLAVYNSELVMMYLLRESDVYACSPAVDCFCGETPETVFLRALLERCGARCCISECCSHFDRVFTHYLLCRNGISLTRQRPRRRERRFFSTLDCNTLTLVDYAAKYFRELHGHDDMLYLGRSEAVILMQYDREKNSNLSQVLFSYLMNNRKVDQAARQLYMHRNTVVNKLEKIRKITHLDLDDSNIQLDLMLSILVIEHYQQSLSQTLKFEKEPEQLRGKRG